MFATSRRYSITVRIDFQLCSVGLAAAWRFTSAPSINGNPPRFTRWIIHIFTGIWGERPVSSRIVSDAQGDMVVISVTLASAHCSPYSDGEILDEIFVGKPVAFSLK